MTLYAYPLLFLMASSFNSPDLPAQVDTSLEVNGLVQHTFQPDGAVGKDTYVTSYEPSGNYGDSEELIVAYLIQTYYHYWEVFVQFTELDDPQFQGVTVVSAELQLYVFQPVSGSFVIASIDDRWLESTASWSNHPGYTGNQYVFAALNNDWLSIDVSDYVQDWLDGSRENCGFILKQSSLLDQFMFHSSDYDSNPELRPKLVLTYIAPSPLHRSSWTEIKNSFQ